MYRRITEKRVLYTQASSSFVTSQPVWRNTIEEDWRGNRETSSFIHVAPTISISLAKEEKEEEEEEVVGWWARASNGSDNPLESGIAESERKAICSNPAEREQRSSCCVSLLALCAVAGGGSGGGGGGGGGRGGSGGAGCGGGEGGGKASPGYASSESERKAIFLNPAEREEANSLCRAKKKKTSYLEI
uniref:Uncharacterized protein n=1 Tax=Vespula pensylvanica TaxID=30213 RepID=A0A834NXF9_VESPE|nr:hypothetical protein H0235_010685 [Vespula pensylvanica]